jgi:hypothetical protein
MEGWVLQLRYRHQCDFGSLWSILTPPACRQLYSVSVICTLYLNLHLMLQS